MSMLVTVLVPVCPCVCVWGALSSDDVALCVCVCVIIVARCCCSRQSALNLFRHRLQAAMVRLSKFNKTMPQILAADWVERHHMMSWMRRLSQRAPHLVLMLTACKTPLSDYIVAHLSATCRSSLIDFRFAHILATILSQRLYCRLSLNDIKSLMQAASR